MTDPIERAGRLADPIAFTPIGYHLTVLTAKMVTDGKLKPNIIRVESEEQALEAAKKMFLEDDFLDIYECHLGCLKVFANGSVDLQEFTASDLEF